MSTTISENIDSPLTVTIEAFLQTKATRDLDSTVAYFSPCLASAMDATLGWGFDSYDALHEGLAEHMPTWSPAARSYATGVMSNEVSALVTMVNSPELLGGEMRIAAAVDFDGGGRIVRWVDYWDPSSFDRALYERLRTPTDAFPRDLKDSQVPTQAAPELVSASKGLHQAFEAGDVSAVAPLLHHDVVLEDMALRTQVVGRIETIGYLDRVLADVPYGRASRLRHVVGGRHGGGFEWTASDATGLAGITALELDLDAQITRIASVYDVRRVDTHRRAALVAASINPR